MARVEIATEGWGYIVDTRGRPAPNQLCAIDTTVYAAATGGGTIAAPDFKSDSEGLLPGWLEPGRYTFTEPDSETRTVVAGGGYQTMMDESSVMAKRDTLKFEGSAIELQDDAGNDRTRVIVTGSPGATGPAGSSPVLDVWASEASPGSVTDWGTKINTLLTAGNENLFLGEHTFPFSTQINLDSHPGVFIWGASRDTSILLWKGTGTTSAVNIGGGADKTFYNLALTYDSASFTGNLVDFGTATNGNNKFFHCSLGNAGEDALRTAKSILALRNCIAPQVIDCVIGGAQSAIRGLDIVGDIAANRTANDTKIQRCYFQNSTYAHLTNVGKNWWVTDNTFEMLDCDNAIDADLASTFGSSFWFERNTVWDFDTATPYGVRQRSYNPWFAHIDNNWWFQKSGTNAFVQCDGPGNVWIRGNDFTPQLNGPYIDLGNSATAKKYKAVVEDNAWYGFDGTTAPVANLSGHVFVSTARNGGQGEAVGIGGFERDVNPLGGYQRLEHRTSGSSSPVMTAGPALTFDGNQEIHGNHIAGWILVRFTGNAGPGHIATLTFTHDLWPFPANNGTAAQAWQAPLLKLFPYDPSTLGTSDDYWTYKLSAEAAQSQQATVKINCGVQIPTLTRCVFGYEIVQL